MRGEETFSARKRVHYSLGVRIILRHDLSAVPDADDNTQALS